MANYGFEHEKVVNVSSGSVLRIAGVAVIALLVVILLFAAVARVPAGHVGVLTLFGRVTGEVLPDGSEARAFHIRDGLAVVLAQRAGLRTGIVSGRSSEAVARRAAELGMAIVRQGVRDKGSELRSILQAESLRPEEVAYIGDDVNDLPVLTEDSFPGVLANVIAGRIANRLDLRGGAYTIDAACAAYITGVTYSPKFPTTSGAYDP